MHLLTQINQNATIKELTACNAQYVMHNAEIRSAFPVDYQGIPRTLWRFLDRLQRCDRNMNKLLTYENNPNSTKCY